MKSSRFTSVLLYYNFRGCIEVMSSVGETLRRERLRKDLGLEQISRETKVSTRLLEAIEKDQFELLPGGVFAKSFVRQYARFLGLDEEEMAAEVEKALNPAGTLPSFAGSSEPTFKVPPVVEWDGGGRPSSSVLPALAMVVAVMLVCSGLYAWWQRSKRPAVATASTAAAQNSRPAVPRVAESSPVTPAVSNTPESAHKTDVSASAPEAGADAAPAPAETLDPAATLQVSLTADAEAWVQVWADGKSVMSRVLQPNEVKTIAAVDGLRIRTGNAGSLQVTVNGKPAGTLGPKGQVRTLEVTRDGIHILLPPPKPAPAPALEPL
jgi:cytoskeleton protein RodZ